MSAKNTADATVKEKTKRKATKAQPLQEKNETKQKRVEDGDFWSHETLENLKRAVDAFVELKTFVDWNKIAITMASAVKPGHQPTKRVTAEVCRLKYLEVYGDLPTTTASQEKLQLDDDAEARLHRNGGGTFVQQPRMPKKGTQAYRLMQQTQFREHVMNGYNDDRGNDYFADAGAGQGYDPLFEFDGQLMWNDCSNLTPVSLQSFNSLSSHGTPNRFDQGQFASEDYEEVPYHINDSDAMPGPSSEKRLRMPPRQQIRYASVWQKQQQMAACRRPMPQQEWGFQRMPAVQPPRRIYVQSVPHSARPCDSRKIAEQLEKYQLQEREIRRARMRNSTDDFPSSFRSDEANEDDAEYWKTNSASEVLP